jgi:hypothetical protein
VEEKEELKEIEALHWVREVIILLSLEEITDTLWAQQIWINIATRMKISLRQIMEVWLILRIYLRADNFGKGLIHFSI